MPDIPISRGGLTDIYVPDLAWQHNFGDDADSEVRGAVHMSRRAAIAYDLDPQIDVLTGDQMAQTREFGTSYNNPWVDITFVSPGEIRRASQAIPHNESLFVFHHGLGRAGLKVRKLEIIAGLHSRFTDSTSYSADYFRNFSPDDGDAIDDILNEETGYQLLVAQVLSSLACEASADGYIEFMSKYPHKAASLDPTKHIDVHAEHFGELVRREVEVLFFGELAGKQE